MAELKKVHPNITDLTVIYRNPLIVTSEIDGEILMMKIEQTRSFSLNAVGSDIWRFIEAPCSFAELVNRLANHYEANHKTIAMDLSAFLNRMAEEEIIRLA